MPPAKKAAPAAKKSAAPVKATPQMTVTLKHLAAALSDSQDLPKKQAEAVLGELVTLTTRHLKKGAKIRLNGLGIPQVRKRARTRSHDSNPVRALSACQRADDRRVAQEVQPSHGHLRQWDPLIRSRRLLDAICFARLRHGQRQRIHE